jgi:hypothetical protein
MDGKVFISYSQPDRECAFEMVGQLEARGIRCWIAPRDITPASDWAAEIIDAISSARAMILVLSASSNDSPQVRREVERAVHKQLIILPFRIEDVRPSKSLEFFLSTQHWMDAFPPPREPHYARLCSYLKAQAPPSAIEGHAEVVVVPPTVQALAVNSHDFEPGAIRGIEALLADYIGPLAKHLVKRAAQRAKDLEDLIERLAPELEAPSDRRAFVQGCREIGRAKH